MFILYNIFAVFTKIISPGISFYRKQEFECTFLFINYSPRRTRRGRGGWW